VFIDVLFNLSRKTCRVLFATSLSANPAHGSVNVRNSCASAQLPAR
jgi:hypothetical protein